MLMQELLQNTSVPKAVLGEVARLIRVTTHQEIPKDLDAMIVSGIDLLILGQPGAVFWRYDRNIRKEYKFVPQIQFCKKRAAILGRFLKRPKIFCITPFYQTYEKRARRNLALCIKKLKHN